MWENTFNRLGNSEIDYLGKGFAILESDKDVGGLDIPVDHPFLMRIKDGLADLDEQVQSFVKGE